MLTVKTCPSCVGRRTIKDGSWSRHITTHTPSGRPEVCRRSGTVA